MEATLVSHNEIARVAALTLQVEEVKRLQKDETIAMERITNFDF